MISSLVTKLLFDYDSFTESDLINYCKELTPKVLRWLGENHPDNRIRKSFYRLTNVSIGEDSVINKNFVISDDYEPLLMIGDRVAISPNVTIICASGPNNSYLSRNTYVQNELIISREVVIGDDSWIGTNAVILPGVTVGKNCVIGAGAIVSKDIPDNSIVAGNPAKLIRKI